MKKFLALLSVSLLIAGGLLPVLSEARGVPKAPVQAMDRDLVLQAQRQLKALGFNPGAVDGKLGAQTEAALREYQRAYRLAQTGLLDEATQRSLLPERFQAAPAPANVPNQEVVLQAQRQLKALGFNPGDVDGELGAQTQAALREYQRQYRLPQSGTLDEATARSLLPERFQATVEPSPTPVPTRPGPVPIGLSNREVVRRAQIQLRALGFEPGTVDGALGPQTEAAVREYQRAYRLPQTGTLDEATLRSLLPEMRQSSVR
jgi:peptidoglycan hydrolase-like protein with peptidoglycan-binding domain